MTDTATASALDLPERWTCDAAQIITALTSISSGPVSRAADVADGILLHLTCIGTGDPEPGRRHCTRVQLIRALQDTLRIHHTRRGRQYELEAIEAPPELTRDPVTLAAAILRRLPVAEGARP